MKFDRIIILVLDGCGCGIQPDFKKYHSKETNTLGNLFNHNRQFRLPLLESLGLSQILSLGRDSVSATYGVLQEKSSGNDTFAGVWEMTGVPFQKRFRSGKRGLGKEYLNLIKKKLGINTLCNLYMSGYRVLDAYYDRHLASGDPILYIADDGVILLAGHKNIIMPDALNSMANEMASVLFDRGYARIITRPFTGNPRGFQRLEEFRKDFILAPLPNATLFTYLKQYNVKVRLTDHLYRIFGAPAGVSVLQGSYRNKELMGCIENDVVCRNERFFMYVLQDTDNFGHKKDASGFEQSLVGVDKWLINFIQKLRPEDLLFITADHGCDPNIPMRGHAREYVPLLVFSKNKLTPGYLGRRKTFADIGQTICYNYGLPALATGTILDIF